MTVKRKRMVEPYCRECGYILRRINEPAAPKRGADTSHSNALRFVRRTRACKITHRALSLVLLLIGHHAKQPVLFFGWKGYSDN